MDKPREAVLRTGAEESWHSSATGPRPTDRAAGVRYSDWRSAANAFAGDSLPRIRSEAVAHSRELDWRSFLLPDSGTSSIDDVMRLLPCRLTTSAKQSAFIINYILSTQDR